MIRINNKNYEADMSFPVGLLVAKIYTEDTISEVFSDLKNATELSVLDVHGEVAATYRCEFSGIERDVGGYVVTFTRAPMSEEDVATLMDTVTSHSVAISESVSEFNDILDAITELGDLIASIIDPEEAEE